MPAAEPAVPVTDHRRLTILVRHTLTATGTCPNNGLPDRYRIAVYTDGVLLCE